MLKTRGSLYLALILSLAPDAIAGTFSDGFEGAVLDPFWTTIGPGTATLTGLDKYAGNQSALLRTSQIFPWEVDLIHDFGVEQTGSISVYLHGGFGGNSAAAIAMWDSNQNALTGLQINNAGYAARVFPGRPLGLALPEIDYFFSRPGGWHQLEIDTDSGGVTFKFDGDVVFTDPSIKSFRMIDLAVWGAPSENGYFDNFSSTTSGGVPEPATWSLLGLGLTALICRKPIFELLPQKRK